MKNCAGCTTRNFLHKQQDHVVPGQVEQNDWGLKHFVNSLFRNLGGPLSRLGISLQICWVVQFSWHGPGSVGLVLVSLCESARQRARWARFGVSVVKVLSRELSREQLNVAGNQTTIDW